MRRIALGRATLLSLVAGLLLAQGASGCGSTATPGAAEGGASEEGGSPGETGGFGATAGESDSGAPGETGGAGPSGGMGGNGGNGAVSSSGFTSGGVSDGGGGGGKAGSTGVSGGTAGTSFGGKAGGTSVSGGNAGTTGGFGGTFGGTSGGFGSGGLGKAGGTGTGGAPSCVNGAPCSCTGEGTVGTVTCDASGGSECVCPPAEECTAKGEAPCFEPCGGEPFGAWVLEDSCFSRTLPTGNAGTCPRFAQGTPGDSTLRIRILDGGTLEVYGREDWTIATQEALSCLSIQSVESCQFASVWPDALLFATAAGQVGCSENACGVCDCEGALTAEVSQVSFQNWSRSGKNLQLGFRNVPYCAKADELWIGGRDTDGTPKVSYKFKKQSCQGKPLACAERTAEQCSKGYNCQVGACRGASGTVPRCATAWDENSCGVLQGCVWDPDGCAGTASETCEFATCGDEPGCTWGPPNEHCGGVASPCEDRDATQCAGGGCSARVCQPNGAEYGACQLLSSAVDCGKAPGCSWTEGTSTCTGTSLCAAQTDTAVCGKLNCWASPWCGGVPPECASLSLDACPNTLGCRLEW